MDAAVCLERVARISFCDAAERGTGQPYRLVVGGAAIHRQKLVIGRPGVSRSEQHVPVRLDRLNFAVAGLVWWRRHDAITIMLCRTRQLSRWEADWEGSRGQCEMTERVPVDLVRQPSIGLIGGTETDREFGRTAIATGMPIWSSPVMLPSRVMPMRAA